MNEFQAQSASGMTLYAMLFTAAGLVWNGSAFVDQATVAWSSCVIPLVEQKSLDAGVPVLDGVYYGSVPAAVPPGSYGYVIRQQIGASPAPGDTGVASSEVPLVWAGATATPVATPAATVTLKFTLLLPDPITGVNVPTDPLPGPDGTLATAVVLASPGVQRVDVSPPVTVQSAGGYWSRTGVGAFAWPTFAAVPRATYAGQAGFNYSAGGFVLSQAVTVTGVAGAAAAPPPGLPVPIGWRYLTEPAVEPVSFADVQSQLRIDSTDEEALFCMYIVAARRFAESDTQRTLVSRQLQLVTEPEHDDWGRHHRFHWGRRCIDLPRGPVSSVDAVTDHTGAAVAPSAYRVGRIGVMDVLVDHGLPRPAFITYTAGYGRNAADVPADIRTGILLHVAQLWDNRSASTVKPQSHIALGLDAIYGQYRIGGLIG